jgi:ABC-type phosphate/phosphonate transport system permease subunit
MDKRCIGMAALEVIITIVAIDFTAPIKLVQSSQVCSWWVVTVVLRVMVLLRWWTMPGNQAVRKLDNYD